MTLKFQIYENFLGGYSKSDILGAKGSFYDGRQVEIYDVNVRVGYIRPGAQLTNLTNVAAITELVVGFATDAVNDKCYAIGATILHQITISSNTITNAGGVFPHTITGASAGKSVILFKIGTTTYLFYAYNGATTGDIGRYNLTATFDDDYMSTVPAGAGALSKDYGHPMIIGEDGKLYIGNGNNLASFDGQTGANGTFVASALDLPVDLPVGWEITSLFKMKNYIGICAWKVGDDSGVNRSESAVFIWDYVNADWISQIPIADNKILASFNDNGLIYLFTYGLDYACLRILTDEGSKKLKTIRIPIGTSLQGFDSPKVGALDVFQNRLLFGVKPYAFIFAYGSPDSELPKALVCPFGAIAGDAGTGTIGALITASYGVVYASVYDSNASAYYIKTINFGTYSTDAIFKTLYFIPPERVQIVYVKFYFKKLVTSDNVTVSLDIDDGTSKSLGTISYTADGAIISKKFKTSIFCDSFRPVIDWTAGGVAFSKIVVAYRFISDKEKN